MKKFLLSIVCFGSLLQNVNAYVAMQRDNRQTSAESKQNLQKNLVKQCWTIGTYPFIQHIMQLAVMISKMPVNQKEMLFTVFRNLVASDNSLVQLKNIFDKAWPNSKGDISDELLERMSPVFNELLKLLLSADFDVTESDLNNFTNNMQNGDPFSKLPTLTFNDGGQNRPGYGQNSNRRPASTWNDENEDQNRPGYGQNSNRRPASTWNDENEDQNRPGYGQNSNRRPASTWNDENEDQSRPGYRQNSNRRPALTWNGGNDYRRQQNQEYATNDLNSLDGNQNAVSRPQRRPLQHSQSSENIGNQGNRRPLQHSQSSGNIGNQGNRRPLQHSQSSENIGNQGNRLQNQSGRRPILNANGDTSEMHDMQLEQIHDAIFSALNSKNIGKFRSALTRLKNYFGGVLSDGALDFVDAQNRSPLAVAVNNNDAAAVELLLESGADVGIRDKQGRTALTRAINNNNFELVKMLINYGALLFSNEQVDQKVASNLKDSDIKELIKDAWAEGPVRQRYSRNR